MYVNSPGLSFSPSEDFTSLKRRWRLFEQMGVDNLWLSDHLVRTFKPDSPYRDAWSLLPGLAAVTRRAHIGALVTCNTFRHPSVFVRQVMTTAEISKSRLIVGMGAGWYKPEHKIMGIPFPRRPVAALTSTLDLLEAVMVSRWVTYQPLEGYPPVHDWIVRPKFQLPILVGGHGPRMLGVAQRYAQIWNSFGTPEQMRERNQYLDSLIENPKLHAPIERTIHLWRGLLPYDPWDSVQAYEDTLGLYSDCGLTGLIFDAPREHQMKVFEQCLLTTQNPALE
jgi:alkanesulfonate monooxygenase SsuD/methylene tetrahydromethanopterin reductase-like flavin-dependent oxidoreductase (luciferase family)